MSRNQFVTLSHSSHVGWCAIIDARIGVPWPMAWVNTDDKDNIKARGEKKWTKTTTLDTNVAKGGGVPRHRGESCVRCKTMILDVAQTERVYQDAFVPGGDWARTMYTRPRDGGSLFWEVFALDSTPKRHSAWSPCRTNPLGCLWQCRWPRGDRAFNIIFPRLACEASPKVVFRQLFQIIFSRERFSSCVYRTHPPGSVPADGI